MSKSYVVEVVTTVTVRQLIVVPEATSQADARQQAEDIAADNGDNAGTSTILTKTKVVA